MKPSGPVVFILEIWEAQVIDIWLLRISTSSFVSFINMCLSSYLFISSNLLNLLG